MYVDVIFKNGKKGTILKKEYEAGGDHIKCLAEKELEQEPENKELKKQTKKK